MGAKAFLEPRQVELETITLAAPETVLAAQQAKNLLSLDVEFHRSAYGLSHSLSVHPQGSDWPGVLVLVMELPFRLMGWFVMNATTPYRTWSRGGAA
jgi:hypothetical protein